jgi:biotin carboxylase
VTDPAARGRTDRPRVLIVAPHGSYRTAPFVEAAAGMGARAVVASEGRHSIVGACAGGLQVDFQRPGEALGIILADVRRNGPYAGVIGTDDDSAELGARIAASLGLPHNAAGAVAIARRKDWARARLSAAGCNVPRHRLLDLRRPLPAQLDALPFPCVLKPVSLSASRGVIRVNTAAELLSAAARIAVIISGLPDEQERNLLLAEEFVPGFEIAIEGMLCGGRLELLTIFDKPDPLDGPFFEETYYVSPSRLSPAVRAEVHGILADACAAYGLREGPIHAECRVDGARAWVIELAARTIGGLCARLFRLGTGFGLEEYVLAHAMGQPLSPRAESEGAGVLMIPIPGHGVLRRVEGVTAAADVPGVEDVVIYVREGYELVPLPEGSSYLGFIFARAETAAEAEAALREAHSRLRVIIAPIWKADVGGPVGVD